MTLNWIKEFNSAITVCDKEGIILEMNDKACQTFAKSGGSKLIGQNALDCHPEPAKTKLLGMLKSGKTNTYTIEKNGKKKLIYQSPWTINGVYQGFIELSMEIPVTMPHFVRKND